jgi:hypothetical protein
MLVAEQNQVTEEDIMRMSRNAAVMTLGLLGSGLLSESARADNILIQNQGAQWKLGTTVANPLPVEVKKGDVLEFRVTGNHGVVTISKPGDQSPSAAPELVLACGQNPGQEPKYPLREIECDAGSKFNVAPLRGSLKLEVTDKFQDDVNFWCIIHEVDMWGTFKLQP